MNANNAVADLKILSAGGLIAAANNTNSLGTEIDTAGFDGCLFIAPITVSVATGVASASVEQAAAAGGAYAAVVGDDVSKASAADNDLNNKFLVIDVFKPRKRYLKLRRGSATANITFGPAIAILYNAHERPTALGDVLARAGVVSPAES